MSDPTRREAIGALAALALVAPLACTPEEASNARAALRQNRSTGQPYQPRFFTAEEWERVRVLVDMILPADERSGSATDAEVPEFIDFVLTEGNDDSARTQVRGGLTWLDRECRERFNAGFLEATAEQRGQVLDDIAWPARAPAELSHGVRFFNRMRDLTASGFWSSQMGVEDLQYMGNVMNPGWAGCPPEQLEKLGLNS
ncbi:MAG: gluconate 2-dehydrogenase subunit 3 family protein [Gemmatimonadota bacterium]